MYNREFSDSYDVPMGLVKKHSLFQVTFKYNFLELRRNPDFANNFLKIAYYPPNEYFNFFHQFLLPSIGKSNNPRARSIELDYFFRENLNEYLELNKLDRKKMESDIISKQTERFLKRIGEKKNYSASKIREFLSKEFERDFKSVVSDFNDNKNDKAINDKIDSFFDRVKDKNSDAIDIMNKYFIDNVEAMFRQILNEVDRKRIGLNHSAKTAASVKYTNKDMLNEKSMLLKSWRVDTKGTLFLTCWLKPTVSINSCYHYCKTIVNHIYTFYKEFSFNEIIEKPNLSDKKWEVMEILLQPSFYFVVENIPSEEYIKD